MYLTVRNSESVESHSSKTTQRHETLRIFSPHGSNEILPFLLRPAPSDREKLIGGPLVSIASFGASPYSV